MVVENHVDSLDDIELVYKKNKYPVSRNAFLPKPFFVSLFIGARASGKTYSCVQLLKQYEKCGIIDPTTGKEIPQRVILFSPTVSANPVFNSLKYLSEDDIYTKYTDDKLKKVVKEIQRLHNEIKEYKEAMKVYNKLMKNKHKISPEEYHMLEMRDFQPPEKPEYTEPPCIFIIFDDLIGTEAFKSVGKSQLTNLVLKNRHLGINILILSQNLKAIPKSIRINTSLFVIFKFANKKAVEDVYEEVQNVLTEQQFHELLDHATSGEHDAFVIDFTNAKEQRFKKNWNKILII